ncbi:SMP-30/gluconolactonase/LRE family protein [Nocardia sp. NPDC051750]|uniref:SMP-30/gluconolactonase/LRE family protein n=1 Tax=Nocardia sp. NPDC051750 TaxID=3364325 RepID=UPI0037ADD026
MTDWYEAVAAGAELGEGPTWDAESENLWWVDILASHVHRLHPATGTNETLVLNQHVGAIAPRATGGSVLNLRDGVGLLDPAGEFSWLHFEPVPGRRGNDAAVAPDGALWAGTMRYDEAAGGGTLSRIAADGAVTLVLDDVTVSNGIGWSPDGSRMYYVDSPTRRIDVFTFVDGQARDRRSWVEIEQGAGWPDGLTVDSAGAVWVALWDGAAVRRYTPDGRLDQEVPLPVSRPTSCAFGGSGLTDLYVTSARTGLTRPQVEAGSLLVVPDVGRGLPQTCFAG